jgi:hypothetical protein
LQTETIALVYSQEVMITLEARSSNCEPAVREIQSSNFSQCKRRFLIQRVAATTGRGEMTLSIGKIMSYKYDVFVSYAHVDDDPLIGVQEGWVSTLKNNLEKELARRLGRKEKAIVWMDHNLSGHEPLTPAIMQAIRESATLVIIASEGYRASSWCSRERKAFLNHVKERKRGDSRIFLVERDEIAREDLPDELQDLLGYRFWVRDHNGEPPRTLGIPVPRPEEQEYYRRLNKLSYDLAAEIKRLRNLPEDVPPNPLGPTVGPKIFLAEVTDDLDMLREEVESYLLQAGFQILPQIRYSYVDPTAYQGAMERDLKNCRLFVQLLSEVPGKKLPGSEQRLAALQYQQALLSGQPILQWRNRSLKLEMVTDAKHLELLRMGSVQAGSLEEFKERIRDEANCPPKNVADEKSKRKVASKATCLDADRSLGAPPPLVFIHTDSTDHRLAQDLSDLLVKHRVGAVLPLSQGKVEEIRTDIEENLHFCDGVIFLYGSTSVGWVRQQLKLSVKTLWKREQPLRGMAICEAPPEPKADPGVILPGMIILNCRQGWNQQELLDFIDRLLRKQ